ncbi:hypothetical protein GN244_ATG07707 [Phytophthora infestans]|uniref:Uncharacterized protein n=1 Tax=Phytophthora infestans TaxID=4787 RepID=A0A833SSY3_PHYIN|nr:hypothetical protein GN244_ATG07707 [Phytophthora infestans]
MPVSAATSCSARLFLRLADAVRPTFFGTIWRSTTAGPAVTCSRGPAVTASTGLSASSAASTLAADSLVTAGVSSSFSAVSASSVLSGRYNTLSQSGLQGFRSSSGLNRLSRSRRLGAPSTVACAWCSSSWFVYGRFSFLLVQRRGVL